MFVTILHKERQPFDVRISYLLRIVKDTRSLTVYFIILQAHMYLFLPY